MTILFVDQPSKVTAALEWVYDKIQHLLVESEVRIPSRLELWLAMLTFKIVWHSSFEP